MGPQQSATHSKQRDRSVSGAVFGAQKRPWYWTPRQELTKISKKSDRKKSNMTKSTRHLLCTGLSSVMSEDVRWGVLYVGDDITTYLDQSSLLVSTTVPIKRRTHGGSLMF